MKNKTLITMMTAFALSAAIMPINAENSSNKTENMTVNYSEPATYTFSIPSQGVELSRTASKIAEVSVSGVNLEPQTEIRVSLYGVDDKGNLKLENAKDANVNVYSSVTVDEQNVQNGSVVANFTENGKKDITFSAITGENDGAVKAGTYSTILTFTASIVDSTK